MAVAAIGVPDQAAIDHPPGRLRPSAQNGVWRTPDPYTGRLRRVEHPGCLGGAGRERFFAVNILSGRDRPQRHLGVRGRNGQVQHDLHVSIGE
nr:hypothetical protein [Fodinicola feengrottensis]